MCRLYGFRANEDTKVECGLVRAQNSLLAQSRSDHAGTAHSDGWGIAYYLNGQPRVERRATAAFDDLRFSVTAERVYAKTVLAHVRSATVGVPTEANTHPYVYDSWSFAHNGTVTAFEELGPQLLEETAERYRDLRQGTNDSEVVFYWLLSRLDRAGVRSRNGDSNQDLLLETFTDSIRRLAELSERHGAARPAKLNFLLTNGNFLIASRWNRDLHFVVREGVHDCETCGVPHVDHASDRKYRAVVVASEPITHEAWITVPERSLLIVGAEIEVRVDRL